MCIQNAGDYSQLIGPVFIGNEVAAVVNSTTNTFSHLLCVAEELDPPDGWSVDSGVTFVQVPLQFGVTVPLDERLLRDAVRTVRKVWKKYVRASHSDTSPSILIYCRYVQVTSGQRILTKGRIAVLSPLYVQNHSPNFNRFSVPVTCERGSVLL